MKKLRWIVIGAVIAVIGAAYLNRDTLRILGDQLSNKNKSEQRMQAAETERAKLLDKRATLETSVGQERQARENGYKRKGEKPLFGP